MSINKIKKYCTNSKNRLTKRVSYDNIILANRIIGLPCGYGGIGRRARFRF